LLDHRPAYNSRILNVGVEEQKRYPKGEFKSAKGCHILKLKKVNDNEPHKTIKSLFEPTGEPVTPKMASC